MLTVMWPYTYLPHQCFPDFFLHCICPSGNRCCSSFCQPVPLSGSLGRSSDLPQQSSTLPFFGITYIQSSFFTRHSSLSGYLNSCHFLTTAWHLFTDHPAPLFSNRPATLFALTPAPSFGYLSDGTTPLLANLLVSPCLFPVTVPALLCLFSPTASLLLFPMTVPTSPCTVPLWQCHTSFWWPFSIHLLDTAPAIYFPTTRAFPARFGTIFQYVFRLYLLLMSSTQKNSSWFSHFDLEGTCEDVES